MKKIIALLLLLLVLPVSVMAADVQSMVEELPAADVLQEMDMDQQREVYDRTQAAYDAYMALSEEEKAKVSGAEETFESLFGYFNTLVAPAEASPEVSQETAAPEEGGTGSDMLSTVIAVAIGIFLAKKLVTKKKI